MKKGVPSWIDDDEREALFEDEDLVRPRILEWAAWKDGAFYIGGAGTLAGLVTTASGTKGNANFPVIRADAERTDRIRVQMGERLWDALVLYHVTTASHRKIAEQLGVGRRTILGILDESHRAFAQYWRASAAGY